LGVPGDALLQLHCDTFDWLRSLVVENAVLDGRKVSIHCAGGVIADIRDAAGDPPVAQHGADDRLNGRAA